MRSGGKREQRALLRAPGCPAGPPPARSRRQLANCWNSAGRERAPYIEPGSAAALGRRAGGGERTLTWLGSPGNAARGSRTSGAFLASHWPPPIFFIWGRGRRGLGAGPAAWAPGATWRVRRRWVLLGGGGKIRFFSSGAALLEVPSTFNVVGVLQHWTCLSPPDLAGRSCRALISHPWFYTGRGNCKMQEFATISVAPLVCKRCSSRRAGSRA